MAKLPRRRLTSALGIGLISVIVALLLFGRARAGGSAVRAARVPRIAAVSRSAVSAATSMPPVLERPQAEAPASNPSIVMMAAGDVNLGRECGQAILSDPHYDPFRAVAPLWADADLRFVNLESQLSDQDGETQSPRNRLIFTGPPGGGETLAQAGIAVVSTANNHAWDYGRSAFFETLDNLGRAGVAHAGTGRTLSEAYEPVVREVRGRRLAIVAVTHIWNAGPIEQHEGRNYVAWARLSRLRSALVKARASADFVILSYHGGVEYIDAPPDPTRHFLESAVKTGLVDAVIGHHPHVPQGVGFIAGHPVFYSLGNFVFAGHDWAPWTLFGFVARLEFGPERTVRVSACPVAIDGHVPTPIAASDARSSKLRDHLVETSRSVGRVTVAAADARGCFAIEPAR